VGSGRWLADEGEGMVRGYEVSKDRYVSFTTDELRKLEAEKTDRFDIESTDRALECSERV
jgi:non-homologous end joining protein Ku